MNTSQVLSWFSMDQDEHNRELIVEYFAPPNGYSSKFSGSQFERIGPPVSDEQFENEITRSDILAVTSLGISVDRFTIEELLCDAKQEEIKTELARIPPRVDLWSDEGDALIQTGAGAQDLWKILRGVDGVGPVTASKLMAKKRPHLIPIYDKYTRHALGLTSPVNYWKTIRGLTLSQVDGVNLHVRLEHLRSTTPQLNLSIITPLRIFDVVVWMRKRNFANRSVS